MNKKKITSLLVAGALTVAVPRETLAYFISTDTVTNNFTTAKTGIEIVEEFKEPTSVKPGDEVNKDVQVKNIADYAQFIRTKLTPVFTDNQNLDTNNIQLNFVSDNVSKTIISDKTDYWYDNTAKDGYYYYIGKVAPEALTAQLLDSVTLKADVAKLEEYQRQKYTVTVDAEGVQADSDAYLDWESKEDLLPKELETALKDLQ